MFEIVLKLILRIFFYFILIYQNNLKIKFSRKHEKKKIKKNCNTDLSSQMGAGVESFACELPDRRTKCINVL